VTNDLLIGHLHDIERFHWFVRAYRESAGGTLASEGAKTEQGAASQTADTTEML
jgi:starvation-inducible DNA-binding protein